MNFLPTVPKIIIATWFNIVYLLALKGRYCLASTWHHFHSILSPFLYGNMYSFFYFMWCPPHWSECLHISTTNAVCMPAVSSPRLDLLTMAYGRRQRRRRRLQSAKTAPCKKSRLKKCFYELSAFILFVLCNTLFFVWHGCNNYDELQSTSYTSLAVFLISCRVKIV